MKKVGLFVILLMILFPIDLVSAYSLKLEKELPSRLKTIEDHQQVMIVEGSQKSNKATFRTYEKINNQWKLMMRTSAVIGKNGLSSSKKEGDGKTPMGTYTISEAFGFAKKPSNLRMRYTQTNNYHYWIDDAQSADYNQWVYYRGNPSKRWKSFERMNHYLYKYAVIIDYNRDPIVKGKGSAIFLHRWRSEKSPTAGCVALSEKNLLSVMRWLDPKKKPIIIIGDEKTIINELKTK